MKQMRNRPMNKYALVFVLATCFVVVHASSPSTPSEIIRRYYETGRKDMALRRLQSLARSLTRKSTFRRIRDQKAEMISNRVRAFSSIAAALDAELRLFKEGNEFNSQILDLAKEIRVSGTKNWKDCLSLDEALLKDDFQRERWQRATATATKCRKEALYAELKVLRSMARHKDLGQLLKDELHFIKDKDVQFHFIFPTVDELEIEERDQKRERELKPDLLNGKGIVILLLIKRYEEGVLNRDRASVQDCLAEGDEFQTVDEVLKRSNESSYEWDEISSFEIEENGDEMVVHCHDRVSSEKQGQEKKRVSRKYLVIKEEKEYRIAIQKEEEK